MSDLKRVESVIYDAFCYEPFHSFNFVDWINFSSPIAGGTCSDKVLSVFERLKSLDSNVQLHEAFIGGIKCHRILRIKIGGALYFADVGNGWPMIRAFPAHKPIQFSFAGIQYHSIIEGNKISIFQQFINTTEAKLVTCFTIEEQDQHSIHNKIKNRQRDRKIFPFNNEIRFAQIIDSRFLFLKNKKLTIFTEDKQAQMMVNYSTPQTLVNTIHRYFNISLGTIDE